jgi:tetratricopeptide (TPR) repeat protein
MKTVMKNVDPSARSAVGSHMTARLGAFLLAAAATTAACGGGSKKAATTPTAGAVAPGKGDGQSMNDADPVGDPGGPNGGAGNGATTAGNGAGGGAPAAGPTGPTGPAGAPMPTPDPVADGPLIVAPNYDPDPATAQSQVGDHLKIARSILSANPPDADGALREAKQALTIDAANVDAAAMVAFAYYHKKLYDTAELVLDDLFKRETAKKNPNVFYVYGLVYDKTNRAPQAVLAFQKAVELNPNFASAQVNLGVHQLRNKAYPDAVATFERLTRQFGRNDVITLTSLGSAYRGHAADYPLDSGDRNQLLVRAEDAYKHALTVDHNYGPTYYNLGLLYLDADPFPSGSGTLDTLVRLNQAKAYFDSYKNAVGFDAKLYDDRMKDIAKATKREEKRRKKAGKGAPP